MKNETPKTGEPRREQQPPAPEELCGPPDPRDGRSGEGAHSAMKHWLHEERHRIKRTEH
jgi:hypothetical protein